jgi:Concanavalin A-like lectin/glucanases superfamily
VDARRRGWLARLSVWSAGIALAATGVPAAARAEAARPASPAVAAAGSAALQAQARALAAARRSGRRVEVASLGSATTRVFANPSGTMTLEAHAQPARARPAGAVAAAATAANPSVSLGLVRWGNIIGSPASLQGQTIAQDPFRGEGAKVGKGCDSSCYLYRSVWDFSIGALGGRHVLNATFAATLYHSWSCSDTPVELWNVGGGISDSYAWNTLGWPTYLDTRWGHANGSSCGQPPVRMEFAGSLAANLNWFASGWWSEYTVGLKAQNESDVNQWKRFYADATLAVEYNSYPATPDQLDVEGKGCAGGAARPFVATATPLLQARVSDPDGGQLLSARFDWAVSGVPDPLVGSATTASVGNGALAQVRVPPGQLAEGRTYAWRVTSSDGTDSSPTSGWCEFTVDTTPPDRGTVTSADYPSDQELHGVAGRTGHFVLHPPTGHPEDVAFYKYALDCKEPGCATAVPTGPSAPATNFGTPDIDGYCRSLGYQGGSLDGATAYDWHCVSGGGSHVGLDLVRGCGWQYGEGTWQPRSRDFNNPYSWECWRATADYSAVADVTPPAGPHDLFVWTMDRASQLNPGEPTDYHFLVRTEQAPQAQPAARWSMSEASGTTAADGTGHGNPATLSGGVSWTGQGRAGLGAALSFDGAGGYAATAGPVRTVSPDGGQPVTLRTDQSFTVAAWVKPASVDDTRGVGWWPTAVSAEGLHNSAFFLRYTWGGAGARWAFTVAQSDADGASHVNLTGTSPVRAGVWTHVAGSYDAASRTMRLYVNGALEGSTTAPGTFNASGGLAIGRAKWNSALNHFLPGAIDEVRLYDRLLSGDEIAAIANAPALTGRWELDEGTGTLARDSSAAGATPNTGTLSGGATWTTVNAADARPDDGGLPDGTHAVDFTGSGAVTAGGPALRTDASFTVAAWVRLTDPNTGVRTAVSQDGSRASGFYLQYRQPSGKWVWLMPGADADNPPLASVESKSAPRVGTWTHLAGVYDGATHQLLLYVDGVRQGSATLATPAGTSGPLVIGRAKWNGAAADAWQGDIAGVRTYVGVLPDNEIKNLAGV